MTTTAYYNEFDAKTAAWLRELIKAGHIAPGDVDERSIKDVRPDDLKGYAQVHFFAGVSGWSLALRLAGISDDAPIWTGSPPCQPFSCAGKGEGVNDERHLWPDFFRLIDSRRPRFVAGEQVEDAIEDGWLDALCDDMEAIGYSVWPAVLPACCVGSPTIRNRLFWVADSAGKRRRLRKPLAAWRSEELGRSSKALCFESWPDGRGSSSALGVADVLSPSHGIPGRVGFMRGYGNAIVPQVAAEFIQAYCEVAI